MIKEKLMAAVKEAAANYNGGMSANESVAKAAEAADFNSDQADRLVEMFNTLVTLRKQADHDDPTGSCELASKGDVEKMLLGIGSEKTASAASPGLSDYSFYGTSPEKTNAAMSARSEASGRMLKAAYDKRAAEAVPPELDVSQGSLYAAIDNSIMTLKTAGNAADDVVRGLGFEIERGIAKIAAFAQSPMTSDASVDMFKATCPEGEVVKRASQYSARLAASDGGEYARAAVVDTTPDVDSAIKVAEEVAGNMKLVEGYEKRRDYFLGKVAEFQGRMRKAVGLVDKGEQQKKASVCDMVDFSGVGKNDPFGGAGQSEADSEARLREDLSAIFKKAGLEDRMEKGAAPFFFNISPEDAVKSMIGAGKAVGEQKRLLNARRAMILDDLLTNDPIISEADPNVVAEAYKTMIMSSPRVSLDKAQARSFLRSAVNSVAISPADAKMLTDVEKGIAMNSRLSAMSALDSSIKDSNI